MLFALISAINWSRKASKLVQSPLSLGQTVEELVCSLIVAASGLGLEAIFIPVPSALAKAEHPARKHSSFGSVYNLSRI